MQQLGSRCPDVAQFLEAGKVCAWRAGMAHYREGALDTGRRLDPNIAAPALGLTDIRDPGALECIIGRLRDNRWLSVEAAAQPAGTTPQLRIVRKLGGFRGFAGPFLAPPVVTCADGEFFVQDGESCWHLTTDRFGATLHRTENTPVKTNPTTPFQMSTDGTVKCAEQSKRFAELQGSSSWAANRTTLAVTTPLSHLVYLVALAE
jgi:hypothetical protein